LGKTPIADKKKELSIEKKKIAGEPPREKSSVLRAGIPDEKSLGGEKVLGICQG